MSEWRSRETGEHYRLGAGSSEIDKAIDRVMADQKIRTPWAQRDALVFEAGLTDFDVLVKRKSGGFLLLDFKFRGLGGEQSREAVGILGELARASGSKIQVFNYDGSDGPGDKVTNLNNLKITPSGLGNKPLTWAEYEKYIASESASPLVDSNLYSQLGQVPLKSVSANNLLFRAARNGSYTIILPINDDVPQTAGYVLPVIEEFVNSFRVPVRFFKVNYSNATAAQDAGGQLTVEPLNAEAKKIYFSKTRVPKQAFNAYLKRDFQR